ncbi:hypothetical protein STEG23_017902, partial [Scotinomys teguina]
MSLIADGGSVFAEEPRGYLAYIFNPSKDPEFEASLVYRTMSVGEAGNDTGTQTRSLITALSCECGDERRVAVMNLKSRNDACILNSSRNRMQSDPEEDETRDRKLKVTLLLISESLFYIIQSDCSLWFVQSVLGLLNLCLNQ